MACPNAVNSRPMTVASLLHWLSIFVYSTMVMTQPQHAKCCQQLTDDCHLFIALGVHLCGRDATGRAGPSVTAEICVICSKPILLIVGLKTGQV